MDELFRFVRMEFTTSLGPPPGRYPVLPLDPGRSGRQDALLVSLVGAAAARPLLLRRTKPVEPEAEPREVALLSVTWAQTSDPLPMGRRDAERELAELRRDARREALIGHSLEVLNTAIRAAGVAVGDPYCNEVSRLDPREVQIGLGTGKEIDGGFFTHAVSCPPPARGRVRLAERLRPSEAVLVALTGRNPSLDSEVHLLRGLLDLDQGRDASALLELDAAVELLAIEQSRFDSDLVAQHLSAQLTRAEALLPESEALGESTPDPRALLEVTLALLAAAGELRAAAAEANSAAAARQRGETPAAT